MAHRAAQPPPASDLERSKDQIQTDHSPEKPDQGHPYHMKVLPGIPAYRWRGAPGFGTL